MSRGVTILGPDPQFSSSSSHAAPQSSTVSRDLAPAPDLQVMFDPQVPKQIQMLLLGLLANADMPTDLADYADPHPDALTNPDMTCILDPCLSYSLHPT